MANCPPAELCVSMEASIHMAIDAIDKSRRLGLALVIDGQGRLINTLTDGDVRRGMLANLSLDAPVSELLAIKQRMPHARPVVAPVGTLRSERIRIMKENKVRQLPIVDPDGRVTEVASLLDDLGEDTAARGAIVMAGGFGKRLFPLTENMPKPMLPVGGRPMLEILVERLNESGIQNLWITTHFRPEKIIDHFRDGRDFGVKIEYVNEESPLGTAGALSLLERPSSDILVINGDILTQLDFSVMFDYHQQHRSTLTMAVRSYEHVVPFGVVRMEDFQIVSIEEKPRQSWYVSAGIYVLSPEAFDFIRPGKRLDMPELVNCLLANKRPVSSFLIREKWIDIGRQADYERANHEQFL